MIGLFHLLNLFMCVGVLVIIAKRWQTAGGLFNREHGNALEITWDWVELGLNIGLVVSNGVLGYVYGEQWPQIMIWLWTLCTALNGIHLWARVNQDAE
tara:strand:+ start:2112 stop:2405 length:294 start_codon:yes stop_codon:yes gene_type:complete